MPASSLLPTFATHNRHQHLLTTTNIPLPGPLHTAHTRPVLTHAVHIGLAKATVIGKGFLAGCAASCGAVAVTNPLDVIRTRLELQGELALGGTQLYRGALHGG